jgi:5-methylcytosine-specific restriction endonuclease McrA
MTRQRHKKCTQCGKTKPLASFYVRRWGDGKDGAYSWCAECCQNVYPLVKYGASAHTIGNIVPACQKCNFKKHDKDPNEWADSVGVSLSEVLMKAKITNKQPMEN